MTTDEDIPISVLLVAAEAYSAASYPNRMRSSLAAALREYERLGYHLASNDEALEQSDRNALTDAQGDDAA